MQRNEDRFNICYIGRPCYQKNIKFLIEVARLVVAKIPSVKFYLLGVGYYSPDLAQVQMLIRRYSLERHIELVEWLPQSEIFEYIEQSDLYISTSLYEGLPLSIIEAMSLGRPIVASNVVGNVDCVFDGLNGYLLPLDQELFSEKILHLYHNESERHSMGLRSRELFLEHFFIDTQIEKLKKIYKSIAK